VSIRNGISIDAALGRGDSGLLLMAHDRRSTMSASMSVSRGQSDIPMSTADGRV
jgi:hypothetical protein